jgi:hypothetical protein
MSVLPRSVKMKVLITLTLATLALGGGDWEMTQKWQKLKAMESCWGEENMKLYTVEAKKAIAKCNQQDAPELSLPPYRSSYRFVNTMLSKADEMESMQEMFAKLMFAIRFKNQQNSFRPYSNDYQMSDNSDSMIENMKRMMMKIKMQKMMKDSSSYTPYSQNEKMDSNSEMMEMFSKMFNNNKMDRMDNYRTSSNYRKNDPMARMSQFVDMFKNSRSKRDVDLDLGDRLVEKLKDQKDQVEDKVGNMTCVLREMNCLNSRNEIDVQAMKQNMQQYTMPSEWFGERYEEIVDSCYEMASNLPAEWSENSVVTSEEYGTIKLGEIKMFMKCCAKSKTKLCMNQDIKKKVESNFGPMEEILKETQLTESEFFPLVMQLLHGQEMDYLMA